MPKELNINITDRIAKIKEKQDVDLNAGILKLYQRYASLNNKEYFFNSFRKEFIDKILKFPSELRLELIHSEVRNCLWGIRPNYTTTKKILESINNNNELYFCEDAFLRCIVPNSYSLDNDKKIYQASCGYIIDDLTSYYDATKPSRMEIILNSDFKLTKNQIERARKNIDKLIQTHISKYNNQPIYKPEIDRKNVKKILVVDQSYNDYSIIKGMADSETFKTMLDCAIKENPDADVLIKTHPDTFSGKIIKKNCYYQDIKNHDNIYKITDVINPISMIKYVDDVYVCSSQLGFEALMAKKKVHTFGIPFYSNWGLTIDNQKCERRTKKRTLEELFYVAYILMPVYINPKTNKVCEIEEAIDYLIEMRKQYFSESNIKCEL